jgi:hypothetical protein
MATSRSIKSERADSVFDRRRDVGGGELDPVRLAPKFAREALIVFTAV